MVCHSGTTVRAEHFDIDLIVKSAGLKAEAHSDDEPPWGGMNPRPVLRAHRNEPLTWQFFMTNVKPHDPFKHLQIHYYLVAQPSTAQTKPASVPPPEPPLIEGNFFLNFKYHARVGVRQQFQVDRAGTYLLRVESVNSGSDHEHFSAIELHVD